MSWRCPKCDRAFRQINQRHACGAAVAGAFPSNASPALAVLYGNLEKSVRNFGEVEVVARDRYVLFRTTRIFADLTVMRDALRVVVHLGRRSDDPCFVKVGEDRHRISHVALVRTAADLRRVLRFVREAFDLALSEDSQRSSSYRGAHGETG